MLTDTEKEKIELEETYRNEIRNQFQQRPERSSQWGRVLAFFNNAVILWLLSAVFITYGAKKYENYKASLADEKKTNEAIEKLNLEISYRYCRILVQLYLLTDRNTDHEKLADGLSGDDVRKVVMLLKQTDATGGIYVYPEYANWGLTGLMAEQRRNLLHLGKQDKKLDDVIMHLTGLEVFFEVRKVDFRDVRNVAGTIEDELILDQWKREQFYFFEGGKHSPFP
jgi:hypothetical protein